MVFVRYNFVLLCSFDAYLFTDRLLTDCLLSGHPESDLNLSNAAVAQIKARKGSPAIHNIISITDTKTAFYLNQMFYSSQFVVCEALLITSIGRAAVCDRVQSDRPVLMGLHYQSYLQLHTVWHVGFFWRHSPVNER